jgi:DAK2 domain fusion protein YloV
MIEQTIRSSFSAAADAVRDRSEEINKLNVFPVPDGDTGTNMALTLGTVVKELDELPASASLEKVCSAVVHGSLMGARGNSGVITSQILRGLSESIAESGGEIDTPQVALAFRRAVKVAFQAVRKPVEGTILTVLRDVSKCADNCERKKLDLHDTLSAIVAEAFASVARTPDLLPVLKENGVVDSGAFGFAVFLEAFCASAQGLSASESMADAAISSASALAASKVDIEVNDDWEGSEFRYCTEFLFFAERTFDEDAARDFLSSQGDCELLVGTFPNYKIHVHTDHPDRVLDHMLGIGQIFNVFIHNMDMEAHERTEKIASDKGVSLEAVSSEQAPAKPIGVVAVAAGSGEAEILRSLGVDVVVEGGQTMNPSTADILDAISKANVESAIVLPNNGNIVMAAQSAASAAEIPVKVVATKSVPQGFSAMFSFDPSASLEENADAMAEALDEVHDGEVTTAVRDSAAADGTPIHTGDVIGIFDNAITEVGQSIADVTVNLVASMQSAVDGDSLTILAGSDLSDEDFASILSRIAEQVPDLDIDSHRGEQPLYPVIFSIE